ncbi:aspartyl-phosphate phosphatase Spo0E family protein [Ruminiclostridium cellobioparum]|uniref:Spo0E like sporulation regulatory protein n=1 Tax=Ruminiclostridium cellobioparum subsp. termitidis CT1112 TaxID=1195236 RepID=S0FQP8_RUMCE|nr:aspartyl-phosphate phosphatase Spo0E family protein [Ruminiclostridium cellobioparum]EMS70798.1 Spo0E like sporulation regulatory protein [Ruminiclostridium cellobioparum subsp. termitidis CT1112]
MITEIEKLRKKLNDMVEVYDCDSSEVLELSREMDNLILDYYLLNEKQGTLETNK